MNKHFVVRETPVRINLGNVKQKMRRIRTELAMMVQQLDDALERIEEEPKNA